PIHHQPKKEVFLPLLLVHQKQLLFKKIGNKELILAANLIKTCQKGDVQKAFIHIPKITFEKHRIEIISISMDTSTFHLGILEISDTEAQEISKSGQFVFADFCKTRKSAGVNWYSDDIVVRTFCEKHL
ncbi:MAG: hypothetical protein OXQ96_04740, partial [Alphaproteobacteria bacterium]|nr:hypothetical protein [Alphaproteobacteria bacterium]